MFAYSIFDFVLALHYFVADAGARDKGQERMRERVVPDYMPLFRDLTHDVGPLLHVAAYQKKRCANVMLGQDIKQVQCVRIVRAIVDCERNLLRSTRQSAEGLAEPLPRRCHGLIACGD